MRWVTQEHVQVSRICSAWLIRRFIDRQPEFGFVPRGTSAAAVTDGTPFHLPGAELNRSESRSTFEVIVATYDLATYEPALLDLGPIVGEADRLHAQVNVRGGSWAEALKAETPPESPGLATALYGLRRSESDDLALIERAGVLLDAFHEALAARHAGLRGEF